MTRQLLRTLSTKSLLEWSYSEKSAVFVLMTAITLGLDASWCAFARYHDSVAPFVDQFVLLKAVRFYGYGILLCLAWHVISVRARHRTEWHSTIVIFSVMIFSGLSLYAGYLFGLLSIAVGVVIASTPLIGMILMSGRIVVAAVVISTTILLSITYGSIVLSSMHYAPLLHENILSENMIYGKFYFWSQVYFVIPYLILIWLTGFQAIMDWRMREAQIRYLSERDHLTGLYNRGALQKRFINALVKRGRRDDFSIILFDLDYFKSINDNHSHLTGDRALQVVSQCLIEGLRLGDLVGRFGGEEFIIILPTASEEDAVQIAERCRLLLMASAVLTDDQQPIQITASFGVSTVAAGEVMSSDELLRRADMALFQAKANGRNQVQQYRESAPAQKLTVLSTPSRAG